MIEVKFDLRQEYEKCMQVYIDVFNKCIITRRNDNY